MSLLWSFLLCEYCLDFCNRAETAQAWDRQHHSLSLMINSNINNNINSNINSNNISNHNTDRKKVHKEPDFVMMPYCRGLLCLRTCRLQYPLLFF